MGYVVFKMPRFGGDKMYYNGYGWTYTCNDAVFYGTQDAAEDKAQELCSEVSSMEEVYVAEI